MSLAGSYRRELQRIVTQLQRKAAIEDILGTVRQSHFQNLPPDSPLTAVQLDYVLQRIKNEPSCIRSEIPSDPFAIERIERGIDNVASWIWENGNAAEPMLDSREWMLINERTFFACVEPRNAPRKGIHVEGVPDVFPLQLALGYRVIRDSFDYFAQSQFGYNGNFLFEIFDPSPSERQAKCLYTSSVQPLDGIVYPEAVIIERLLSGFRSKFMSEC